MTNLLWKVRKQPRPFSGREVFRAYYLTPRGWVSVKNKGGYPIAYTTRESAEAAALSVIEEATRK